MKRQNTKEKNYGGLTLILILSIGLIILFFYLDRQNQLSTLIRTWGLSGVLLSILLMAALCMTPIPSEGLVIILFKIFGIYEGALFSWLGSIFSSLAIFYLARYFGQGFFKKLITPDRFDTVDHWIRKKGTIGLLIARLLPIPAFAVNYIAGVMPSVKLWPYVWTAALSIIPYYVGAALVYVGVAKSTWIWLAVGGVIFLAFWGISYILSKKANNSLL
ncbi:MAG: VTT domain-containing protein [Desulfotomaculaceae bacterium]